MWSMKPATVLGFGLLLLLFFPGLAASDEPEPFFQSPTAHFFPDAVYPGRSREPDLPGNPFDLQDSALTAAMPNWERRQLSLWIGEYWLQNLPQPELQKFIEEIKRAHELFLFKTGEGGSLLRDERGNPVSLSPAGAEADHLSWGTQLGACMEDLLQRWEREVRVVYQELLSALNSMDCPELEPEAAATLHEYTAEVHREFERLYRQAESQFVRLRLEAGTGTETKDSQPEEVDELAASLIAQTVAALQDSGTLPGADAAGASGHRQLPVVLNARSWQEDFSDAFERGIQTWNQAEQSLYRERIRWEEQARELYVENERAWQAAFLGFEEARERWIQSMEGQLEEGLAVWDQKETEFLLRYEQQVAELAAQSNDQLQKLDLELGNLLSLYRQHIDVVEICERNIERLRNEISALEEKDGPEHQDTLQLLREQLTYWQGEGGCGGVLGDSRRALADAGAAVLDLEDRILVLGSDLLAENELQREIARLESELSYLAGQLDTAAQQDTPESIVSQQREAYSRISATLELLRRMEPSPQLDPAYLALKDRQLELWNAREVVAQTLESFGMSIAEVEAAVAAGKADLETSFGEVFNILEEVGYTVSTGFPAIDDLTDFAQVPDTELADTLELYFSGESGELSDRLSRDMTIWLTAMSDLQGGCEAALGRFGLAYYYDVEVQNDLELPGRTRIELPILRNPNFAVLVEKYLELGPQRKWVWFDDGKLLHRKTVYPNNKLLPEDYLAKLAAQTYQEVQSGKEMGRLYAYFKAMLVSDHFKPGSDFIRDDLTDLAYRYVEGKAKGLQHKWETKWWLFKWRKADEIASLRKKIAPLNTSGAEERISISANIDRSCRLQTDLVLWAHKLDFLSGQNTEHGVDKESFLLALQHFLPADQPFSTILEAAFDRLDVQQRTDNLSSLKGIELLLDEELRQVEATISGTVSDQSNKHDGDLETYLRCLYDPEVDQATLAEAVNDLYSNPAFSRDALREAELHYARLIQPLTLEGEYRKLSAIAGSVYGLMEHRLHLLRDRAQTELQLQFRQIHDQRLLWETKVGEMLAAGLQQWSNGAKRINDNRDRWLTAFTDEYEEKQRIWDGRYELFCRNRGEWVEQSTENALHAAGQSVAQTLDLDADRLIGEIQTITIPEMVARGPELTTLLENSFPGPELTEHLRDALSLDLCSYFRPFSPALDLPAIQAAATADRLASQLADRIGKEIYSRISLATALQMRVYIEGAEDAILDRIAEANRTLADNLFDLMRSSGYRKSGSLFSRSSVIDNTLFGGLEEEKQTVRGYRYFVAPAFDAGVDLSRASLEGRSGDYIEQLVQRGQENLNKYMELIFGRPKEVRATWDWQGIADRFKDTFIAQTASFRASGGFNRKNGNFQDVDGLFPFHIGYEPIMRDDAPEKVQEPGYGELGTIMEAYFRNEARQARGLSMIAVPWYNLRMWDDDSDNDGESDGWFEAPSARDAVDLAVSIAATATGNVWVAAAVNLADDAVFTTADVYSGYIDPQEGLLSFGKQALISGATAGTGLGFDALDGALGAFAEEGVCKALLQGVETATNRVVGATVNAFEFDPDGELIFNTALYKETLIGRQALRSYLAEVAGSSVGYLLEGNLTGFSSEHIEDVRGLSRLVGGVTQAGLGYALTGQTILNLADFSMFGLAAKNRTLSGGFLELRVGGEHPRFALGSEGADVSLTAVTDAASGLDTWIQSMKIRSYDRFGAWESAEDYQGYDSVGTSMRALYSYGDSEGRELYEDLVSGRTELLVGFSDAAGQTQLVGTKKQIQLATLGDHRDRNSRLMAGVVLQHEAHRDGISADALDQQLETRKAVASRAAMLIDLEQDYKGIIGSELKNTIDVLMYQAGEETFNRYVDELWNSEGDFAERVIKKRKIGLRRTLIFDLQKYTPGLAATYRWAVNGSGGDPHKDYLLPESELDPQAQVLEDLAHSDTVATQLNLLGALLGTGSWCVSGGNLGKSILGLNPLDAPDVLGATSALLNDATLARALFDALGNREYISYSSDDVSNVFGQMAKGILEAESLSDMEWYSRATAIYADSKIFSMAERAGIPLKVENRWVGNDRFEAQVVNQMMRNYMFVGEMVFNGITDPEIIRKMYYGGFANPVGMGNGLTLWENVPGFASRNYGPWDSWKDNPLTILLENSISDMNAYSITHYALTTRNTDLYSNLSSFVIDIYDDWTEYNRFYNENRHIWADYDKYYRDVYLRFVGN
jgi:hypothetical protein